MNNRNTPLLMNEIYIELNNLFQKNEFSEMIVFCDSKIKNNEIDYLIWGARGKAYYELEEYDEAILSLSNAIELLPTYVVGFYNRGLSYYFKDKFQLAINDFENLKSFQTDYLDTDFYLGYCYIQIENFEKGIENLSNYLLNYDDELVLKDRFDLYNITNQFEKANEDLAALLLYELPKINEFKRLNYINLNNFIKYPKDANKFDILELGFSVLEENKGSGVYIIQFENGEYYIGQTKEIQVRIKQHHKKYSDIKTILFKPVSIEFLLEEENKMIQKFERKQLRIRNLKQIEFLNIFDVSKQIQWSENLNYNFLSGEKFTNEKLRNEFSERFLILKEKCYFENLIEILSIYIQSTIPNFIASEYNYWNITCLPKYMKKSQCIARININTVPVLSIFEEEDDITLMLYASKLPFLEYLKINGSKLFLNETKIARWDLRDAFKEKTKEDEITIFVKPNEFKKIIENHLYLASIRDFNLRMMNTTGNEKTYRRKVSHCLDLSDYIIDKLASQKISS